MKISHLFSLAAMVLLSSCTSKFFTAGPSPVGLRAKVIEERQFCDYLIRISFDEKSSGVLDQSILEIFQGGKRVLIQKSEDFCLGDRKREPGEKIDPRVAPGMDLDGKGHPGLVIYEYAGGNRGFYCHVYALGAKLRHLITANIMEGGGLFEDLNHDGHMEIMVPDETFDLWHCCGANDVFPTVILRYQNGAYRPATDLMRKPPPSAKDLQEMAAKVGKDQEWADYDETSDSLPVLYRQTLLDLIYQGNWKEASQWIDLAWPKGRKGCKAFRADLMQQLGESPYWPAIKEMNGFEQVDPPSSLCFPVAENPFGFDRKI